MSGQISFGGESLTQQPASRLAARPAAEDRARARLHLLDWLACVAAAALTRIDVRRKPIRLIDERQL